MSETRTNKREVRKLTLPRQHREMLLQQFERGLDFTPPEIACLLGHILATDEYVDALILISAEQVERAKKLSDELVILRARLAAVAG
ncbi:MAG: hypothetical protein P9L99_13375 [Candidatus Lernaella stagnicola]|nr:hypothetical protein [Candidatus Lernaella stagnicola]